MHSCNILSQMIYCLVRLMKLNQFPIWREKKIVCAKTSTKAVEAWTLFNTSFQYYRLNMKMNIIIYFFQMFYNQKKTLVLSMTYSNSTCILFFYYFACCRGNIHHLKLAVYFSGFLISKFFISTQVFCLGIKNFRNAFRCIKVFGRSS